MKRTIGNRNPSQGRRTAAGIGLIELMVALVLGLFITGAAISVFLSNRQTYRATENLGRVQESTRVAFELMARDVREAGGTPCAKNLPTANVVDTTAGDWWADWSTGVLGVEGPFASDNPANRVAGTDAVELKSGDSNGVTVTDHVPASAQFKVNTVDHGLNDGDIVMVCDYRQAAIVQVTNAQPGINETIVHDASGASTSPGNCTKGLGIPVLCSGAATGTPYTYGPNSTIVKLHSARWYIGTNANNNRALYRQILRRSGTGVATVAEEITEGVSDMQITYLLPGNAAYVAAGAVGARWNEVQAARIELTLDSPEEVGVDGNVLQRTLVHTVTLRNRNS
ncbi:Tfp pilus assembly protein PilW [Lysobacter maris]|uniref:Tfp pilus assembly protein PilW n=1 Tax=Marilutibacter maris TaxID=1605891 RepID=A0A508B635_9GAMM|nr:PilW family protein [Lysobacter maris]KAB8196948.1 Tfp pilus assembly protein PilW [Lysobacter maris]